jgi:parvulin-like peptidyl-prolyl isomerase
VQEAVRSKIKVSKREMDRGLAKVRGRFGSDAEFTEALKTEGLTRAAFDKRIEQQLMVMKLTNQEIKGKVTPPSDSEIQSLYSKIQDKMAGKDLKMDKASEDEIGYLAKIFKRAGAEQIRARHILLTIDKDATEKEKAAALAKIRKIKTDLKAGADFAETAKKNSQDTVTAERGGDLGSFALGDMVPEFEKAAFALNVGEVSEPVLTQYGYHLIRVEEKKASRALSLEDVKNDLRDFIGQKAAQKRYEEWFKNLKSKASVKINEK